jgi:hypothetical protein
MKERTPKPYEIEDNRREVCTGHSPNLESAVLHQVFTMRVLFRSRSRNIKVHATLKFTAAIRQIIFILYYNTRD